MAVAMVFTVVKVNDSKKEVKAGEGDTDSTTTYTDSSYINSTFFNQAYQNYVNEESTPVKSIYVQNNKIQFGLPDMQTEPFDVYWFKDGEGNYGFRLSEGDAGDKYIKFTITDSLSWKNGDSSLTCLNKDNTSATLVVTRSYAITSEKGDFDSDEENEYINEFKAHSDFLEHLTCVDETSSSYTKNVITLNYNVSADKKFTVTNQAGVTDNWKDVASENSYYYGENKFYSSTSPLEGEGLNGLKTDASAEGWKSAEEFNTLLNDGTTYYVYQKYVTGIFEGGDNPTRVWFTDLTPQSFTKGAPDVISVSVNEKPLDGSLTNYFKDDITKISVGIKYAGENMSSVTVQKDGVVPGMALTKASETSPDFSYSTNLDENTFTEGSGVYRIAVTYGTEDNKNTVYSDGYTIVYDKTAPEIGNVTVSQNNKTLVSQLDTNETVAANQTLQLDSTHDITISFPITEELSGVDVSELELLFNGSTYDGEEDGETYKFTIPSTQLDDTTDGVTRSCTINAKDMAGNSATPVQRNLPFTDTAAPIIGNDVTIAQTQDETVVSENLFASDDFTISFPVTEKGSRLNAVNVTLKYGDTVIGDPIGTTNVEGTDENTGVYTCTTSAINLQTILGEDNATYKAILAGNNISYSITATDNSNNITNETQIKTGAITFADKTVPVIVDDAISITQDSKTYSTTEIGDTYINSLVADASFGFGFRATDLTTGISSVKLSITGGTYQSDIISIPKVDGDEYDGQYYKDLSLTGDLLTYAKKGNTLSYTLTITDSNGNYVNKSGDIVFADITPPVIDDIVITQGSLTEKFDANNSFSISFSANDYHDVNEVVLTLEYGTGEGKVSTSYRYDKDGENNTLNKTVVSGADFYSVDVTLSDALKDAALLGNSLTYTITASDGTNECDPVSASITFADKTAPVIDENNITISQNQAVSALADPTTIVDKLTTTRDFIVSFPVIDVGYSDDAGLVLTGVKDDTVIVTLTGSGLEAPISKTATLDGANYKATFAGTDIAALSPEVTYTLRFNASDNAGNPAAEKTKDINFFDESATITITPQFSIKSDTINSNTYADYTSSTVGTNTIYFSVKITSEVPIDTPATNITTTSAGYTPTSGSSTALAIDTGTISEKNKDESESGLYEYTFTTVAVNILTGTYDFNVVATNKFSSVTTQAAPKVYYVDVTNPAIGAGNGYTSSDHSTAVDGSWLKETYVYITGVSDNGNGQSGIVLSDTTDPKNPAITNLELVDASQNGDNIYTFLYKVVCDKTTGLLGTYAVFEIRDQMGNTSTYSNYFKVDDEAPGIAENSLKVYGNVVGTTPVNVQGDENHDATISVSLTDNIHVKEAVIKCTAVPDGVVAPSTDGIKWTFDPGDPDVGQKTSVNISKELSKVVSGNDTGAVLKEGTYTITVDAVDLAGSALPTRTFTIVIDATVPIADIDARSLTDPKSTGTHGDSIKATYNNGFAEDNTNRLVYDYYPYSKNNVTIGFTVNDENVDKKSIVVKDVCYEPGKSEPTTTTLQATDSSDPLGLTPDSTNKKWTGSYTFSTVGVHTVSISVIDKSGNANKPENTPSVTFRIDKKAPTSSISLEGKVKETNTAATHYIYDATVRVNLPALADTEGNLDKEDVYICWKYAPSGSTSFSNKDPKKVTINGTTPADLTFTDDGEYWVWVQAIDLAGNTFTSNPVYFMIDKVNPDIDVKVDTAATKNKFTSEYKHTGTHYNTNYTYSQFFNKDVELTLKVFDFDYNKDTITVTDNGEKIGASFTGSNGEYTAKIKVSEEGKHKIVVKATDTASNEGTSTPVEFTIDKTNPTLDLTLNSETDPEDMLRVDGDVAIGYKLTDTNKDSTDVKITYVFTPAGGAKKDAVTEELYDDAKKTFKENGTYEVKITAIDKAGNSSSDSASFVIDKQKPEIDLKITTSKPAKFDKYKRTYKPAVENYFTTAKDGYEYGQYYKDNVKVKISVFDYDVKGTVVYDNEDEVEVSFKYEGDGLYTGEFTISEEGSHVIKAESVDKSGNTGKSSELSFIIDKTAPALTTTLDGETYSGTDRFCASDAVVGLKIDDKNHDADDVFRSYVITPSDHSAEKTDSSYVTALQETYKQNAYYTVTYTVVDRAGNSSTAKIGFTIDTTKPQSDIKITTKAPAKIDKYHNEYSNTNGHFNTAYTYGQYYNESVSMDMAVFDYNVAEIIVTDNDEAIPVTFASKGDERVASSVTVSSEGEHVVKIIVKDKSGNEATSKSVSFIIDKSEPGLSATLNNSSSITEQYLQGDASVYLSVSDTNEDEDDVTRIVKMTRPSASAETSEETGALEGNVSYSTEADYEITYTAIDRAGNKSDPITLTFRVDKTAPQLSFSGITRDATAAEDTTITYNMLEDFYWDMTSATVKIYQKVDGMGETPIRTVEITASGASTALSETFKEDGQYRFEFTAQDKAGNQATESFTFILDENAPVIILSGVDGYLTDQDVNFGVQVDETFYLGNNVKIEGTVKTLDDPKGVKINFDDYSRLTRMASANFEQLFTEDGIYNIKVTSKDVAGNETVQSIQFTIDKSKPLIKDLENLADEEDYQAYSDAVAANDKNAKKLIPIFNEFNFDYDADDIVTDLTTVTYKMYMDGVLYDGLSEIEDGFHTLKITAEDEVGNTAEKSFYFILDTVKPGIIVTGVEEGDNLQEPTTITVSLQLTEDTLKAVNLNGEAIAITNNTATLEVSDKGDYVLVIEAGDDAGNLATLTIKFEYGKTSSMLWLLIAGGAALLIAAATFFIILGKKRKKNQ